MLSAASTAREHARDGHLQVHELQDALQARAAPAGGDGQPEAGGEVIINRSTYLE
jgi:hypothetical protein